MLEGGHPGVAGKLLGVRDGFEFISGHQYLRGDGAARPWHGGDQLEEFPEALVALDQLADLFFSRREIGTNGFQSSLATLGKLLVNRFVDKAGLLVDRLLDLLAHPQQALAERTESGQLLKDRPGWLPKPHPVAEAEGVLGDAGGVNCVVLAPLKTAGFLDLQAVLQPNREVKLVQVRKRVGIVDARMLHTAD